MTNLPILDCSKISSEGKESFAEKLGDGLSQCGCVYLSNHGLDLKNVEKLQTFSESFFKLPTQTKSKYDKTILNKSHHGYSNAKTSTESRETFDVHNNEVLDAKNFPSAEIQGFKETVVRFKSECRRLIVNLLETLAIYLELDDTKYLLKCHQNLDDVSVKSLSRIRLECDSSPKEGSAGVVEEQQDLGTIGLHFQNSAGGLEIKNTTGEWIKADPTDGNILLTAGHLLEFWTNGHISAATHRKSSPNDEKERKSSQIVIIVATHPDDTFVRRMSVASPPVSVDVAHKNGDEPAFEYMDKRKDSIIAPPPEEKKKI